MKTIESSKITMISYSQVLVHILARILRILRSIIGMGAWLPML